MADVPTDKKGNTLDLAFTAGVVDASARTPAKEFPSVSPLRPGGLHCSTGWG